MAYTPTEFNQVKGLERVLLPLGARNVTPSDTPMAAIALELLVRGAGNLVLTGADGVDVTLVIAAADLPYRHTSAVSVVNAATTCTGIIAYV